MERTDIELFLAVIKWNSITKASEAMNFAQPTASYRLRVLEEEVGTELFQRRKGRRTAELTQQGKVFVDIAKRWLTLYQDTQNLQYYPGNVLSVGAVNSINSSVLMDAYAAFATRAGGYRLNVVTCYSSEIYKQVEDHRLDIGFVAEPFSRKNVITTPLFSQKYYVAHYVQYPTAMRKIDPSSLNPRAEIFTFWGSDYEAWHEKVFGAYNLYHACVDSVELIRRFLVSEEYWAIIPGSLIQSVTQGSRNIQIDELDMDEEFNRVCYMIKHIEPRPFSLEGIAVFEKELKRCIQLNPCTEILIEE